MTDDKLLPERIEVALDRFRDGVRNAAHPTMNVGRQALRNAILDELEARERMARASPDAGRLRLVQALHAILAACRDRKAFVMIGPRAFARAEQIALNALDSEGALVADPMDAVLAEVKAERPAQDAKWGGPEHDDQHDALDWIEYLLKHTAVAMDGQMDIHVDRYTANFVVKIPKTNDTGAFRKQMVRVAALAIAAMQWMDRKFAAASARIGGVQDAAAGEDHVLAALDRARLRPPMPEEERAHMMVLAAEAKLSCGHPLEARRISDCAVCRGAHGLTLDRDGRVTFALPSGYPPQMLGELELVEGSESVAMAESLTRSERIRKNGACCACDCAPCRGDEHHRCHVGSCPAERAAEAELRGIGHAETMAKLTAELDQSAALRDAIVRNVRPETPGREMRLALLAGHPVTFRSLVGDELAHHITTALPALLDVIAEVLHLRDQRDELQANNTGLVEERRASTAVTRPRVGVGVLVRRPDGSLLFGKRKGAHGAGTWAPPGGHLEHGESVVACAARELFEETGIRAGARIRALDVYTHDSYPDGPDFVTLWCVVDVDQDVAVERREPDKCDVWVWMRGCVPPGPVFASFQSLIARPGFDPWNPSAPAERLTLSPQGWVDLMAWTKSVHYCDLGDEAIYFADDASDFMPMPETRSGLGAALSVAFAAGQRWENLPRRVRMGSR